MICPSADAFATLASGSAPPELRAEVADHAATCEVCHAVLVELCPPDPEATQIDRYRIERRLGAGAMGVVYAAYDPDLDRSIAIKLLRVGGSADRLRREAQVLAKLTHPNVVGVFDVGTHGDDTFVAMALVDGTNLREWLRTPRSTAQILDAIVQACRGVAAAHAAGIVHRDLKPDNIFVGHDGVVVVGDFGLASTATEGVVAAAGRAGHVDLTQTGTMLGTPAYMAPEQATGEATPASDQFSLAVTAWELLFAARPFIGDTLDEVIDAARRGDIAKPMSDRSVPTRIVRALRRGLAVDPDARHASVGAFADALSPRRRRRTLAVAGLTAVACVGLLAFARGRRSDADVCAATAPFVATPSQRVEVAAALASVPDTAPGFVPQALRDIDAYADAWSALRHDACVRHDQRPDICLHRSAATAGAVIASIRTRTAAGTLVRLEALEPVDRCRVPDPVASPEVARLRAALADLDLRQRTEEPALLDTDLDVLVARARAANDPGTLAETLALAGASRIARGKNDIAERDLREATTVADGAGDDRRRARALAILVELLAHEGQLREAAAQHAVAVVALARGGTDPI
ncbi:MAG TPA: serine/threonine-protein kinase, partial [Kofleriaceae bacterium]|nr:serine/threonine-protein kinase [Kofleriaceae bacterium]